MRVSVSGVGIVPGFMVSGLVVGLVVKSKVDDEDFGR